MKKELENKLFKIQHGKQSIIDSLQLELVMLSKQTKSNDKNKMLLLESKKSIYLMKKNQFDNENELLAKQFDEQIFQQINQYVRDYGKTYSIEIIFGADGSGTIMFANEANNISDDVIIYINERYKGYNK